MKGYGLKYSRGVFPCFGLCRGLVSDSPVGGRGYSVADSAATWSHFQN